MQLRLYFPGNKYHTNKVRFKTLLAKHSLVWIGSFYQGQMSGEWKGTKGVVKPNFEGHGLPATMLVDTEYQPLVDEIKAFATELGLPLDVQGVIPTEQDKLLEEIQDVIYLAKCRSLYYDERTHIKHSYFLPTARKWFMWDVFKSVVQYCGSRNVTSFQLPRGLIKEYKFQDGEFKEKNDTQNTKL